MSDDEKVKKDKSFKSDKNNESEPITEETSVENEVKTTEEPEVTELKVEETPPESITEEKTESEETKVEEEPIVEATVVEETTPEVESGQVSEQTSEPEPQPETQPQSTNNVVQPDQVVNNNNNYNNNSYSNNNTAPNSTVTNEEPPKKKGMAIWTLVLAVIGFFTGWLVIGGLFDLIAIILAIIVLAKKKDGKGLAITGLIIAILGIIGAIVAGIVLIAVGIPVLAVLGLASNYDDIVDAGEDIYSYATNIIEEVNEEYDFGNYVVNYNTSTGNTTSANSINSNETNTTSSNTSSTDTKKHNSIFDSCLGTGVSSTTVKTLLLEITTNNMTTTKPQTIGVCFITNSDSYKKDSSNTIDIASLKEDGVYIDYCKAVPTETELDSMNFTSNYENLTNISKHISTDKKYTVKVANKKVYNYSSSTGTGFKPGYAKGSTGGVYDSGYYRLIYIYEEN